MKNLKLSLLVFVLVVIVVVTGFIYKNSQTTKTQSSVAESVSESKSTEVSKIVTYNGVEGKTAFDLLNEKYTVEAETSSFGVMVNSINGLKNSDTEYWLYSVNDKSPDVGADKFFTKNSDQVKWEYKGM